MIPYERQELIIKELRKVTLLKINALHELFPSISISTLRRDLRELEESGKIECLSGGAVKLHTSTHELDLVAKSELYHREKELIARLAVKEVDDGETIYIDSGSTGALVLQALLERPITIYTTNTAVCFVQEPTKALIQLIGGAFNPTTASVTGSMTEQILRDIYFDKSFLGVNGIDEHRGVMTPTFIEATKKRIVTRNSRVTYLMCDSSKFHRLSTVKVFDLKDVVVISDKQDTTLSSIARIITPNEDS